MTRKEKILFNTLKDLIEQVRYVKEDTNKAIDIRLNAARDCIRAIENENTW